MKLPDLVAIYAAIVATIVAIWDIAKWLMNRPKLSVEARSPCVLDSYFKLTAPEQAQQQDAIELRFFSRNLGTGIRKVAIDFYDRSLDQIVCNPLWSGVVTDQVFLGTYYSIDECKDVEDRFNYAVSECHLHKIWSVNLNENCAYCLSVIVCIRENTKGEDSMLPDMGGGICVVRVYDWHHALPVRTRVKFSQANRPSELFTGHRLLVEISRSPLRGLAILAEHWRAASQRRRDVMEVREKMRLLHRQQREIREHMKRRETGPDDECGMDSE